jgi:hypothetical protein
MKKILVVFLVMVAFATNVFAVNPNEYDTFNKLYNKSTMRGLVQYLNVDKNQENELKEVFSISEVKLKSAIKTGNETAADQAIWFGMGNTRNILSETQYKKFLAILYVSIYNKNEMLLTEN